MARSFWNGMVALVAVVGLGGSSWMLFAQTPAPPTDRFVTVGVGNEKVRCKVIQAWTLPNGSFAYQVRGVESGELITIVREGGATGSKETPVRVYRWRDAKTSPFGAPVPPTAAPNDASTVVRKNDGDTSARTEVKQEIIVVPPTIIEQMQSLEAAAAPTIVNGDKGGIQTVGHVETHDLAAIRERIKTVRKASAGETTYIAPTMSNETIVIAANQLPAQPAETIVMPEPRMPVEIRTKPVAPPPAKETKFDASVDSQGQSPWATGTPVLVQPGKIAVEPTPVKSNRETELAPPKMPPAPSLVPSQQPDLPKPRAISTIEVAPPPLPPPLPIEAPAPRGRSSDSLSAELPIARPIIPPAPFVVPQSTPFVPEPTPTIVAAPPVVPPAPPTEREIIEVNSEPVNPPPALEPRNIPVAPRAESWKAARDPVPTQDIAAPSIIVVTPAPIAAAVAAPAPTKIQPATRTVAPTASAAIAAAPVTFSSPAKVTKQPGPRVPAAPPAAGFDRTRTTIAPAQLIEADSLAKASAAHETIVEVSDPNAQVVETSPTVRKKAGANVNRSTALMGLVGGNRETRPSSASIYFPETAAAPHRPATNGWDDPRTAPKPQTAIVPAAVKTSKETFVDNSASRTTYADSAPTVKKKSTAGMKNSTSIVGLMSGSRESRPIATSNDRTRMSVGPTSGASAVAATNSTKESIVIISDDKSAQADSTPVVKRKAPMAFNRTTTLDAMVAANSGDTAAAPQTVAAPTATPITGKSRPADGSFDRTRVSITSAPAPTVTPVSETVVEVTESTHQIIDTTPVVRKKSTPGAGRLPILVGFKATDHAPTPAPSVAESGSFDPRQNQARVETKPQQPNAFTPAPQMQRPQMIANGYQNMPMNQPMPPAFMPGMTPPAGYGPGLPPINLVQFSPKSGPVGPANPAMDRPGSAAPSTGEMGAVSQLLQAAKESIQPSRRELAVMSLSNYDGRVHPQLVEFLKHLATSDPAATVRAAAVSALGRMNVAPQTVSGTLETLRTDNDIRVRNAVEEATTALGLGSR